MTIGGRFDIGPTMQDGEPSFGATEVSQTFGEGWTASVEATEQSNGFVNVIAKVIGETELLALEGARSILKSRAEGKEALIRRWPTSEIYRDFEKDITEYRGYVRFAYCDKPGKWTDSESQGMRWFLPTDQPLPSSAVRERRQAGTMEKAIEIVQAKIEQARASGLALPGYALYLVGADDIRYGLPGSLAVPVGEEPVLLTRAEVEDNLHTNTNLIDLRLAMINRGLTPDEMATRLAQRCAANGKIEYYDYMAEEMAQALRQMRASSPSFGRTDEQEVKVTPCATRAAINDLTPETLERDLRRGLKAPILPPLMDEDDRLWPDPTPEMLADPLFDAIWSVIKTWDINVPRVYSGYCGATGNHVRAIYDAVKAMHRIDGERRCDVCDPPLQIASRIHDADIPGKIEAAGYEHLRLPTHAEPQEPEKTLGHGLLEKATEKYGVFSNLLPSADATVQKARADLHGLFAAATVADFTVPTDLSLFSLEFAATSVGRDGTLICVVDQALAGSDAREIMAAEFPNLKWRFESAAVLGSPYAWALLSADGKKAVVGMR